MADLTLGKEIDPESLIKTMGKYTTDLDQWGQFIDKVNGMLNSRTVQQVVDLIYQRTMAQQQGMSQQMGTVGMSAKAAAQAPVAPQVTPEMIKGVVEDKWKELNEAKKKK